MPEPSPMHVGKINDDALRAALGDDEARVREYLAVRWESLTETLEAVAGATSAAMDFAKAVLPDKHRDLIAHHLYTIDHIERAQSDLAAMASITRRHP